MAWLAQRLEFARPELHCVTLVRDYVIHNSGSPDQTFLLAELAERVLIEEPPPHLAPSLGAISRIAHSWVQVTKAITPSTQPVKRTAASSTPRASIMYLRFIQSPCLYLRAQAAVCPLHEPPTGRRTRWRYATGGRPRTPGERNLQGSQPHRVICPDPCAFGVNHAGMGSGSAYMSGRGAGDQGNCSLQSSRVGRRENPLRGIFDFQIYNHFRSFSCRHFSHPLQT
jgi:hypothetical protein